MLVNDAPTPTDVPHEAGHSFLLRRLSWKELKEARDKKTGEARDEALQWGPEMMAVLTKKDPPGDSDADEAALEKQKALDAYMQRQAYDESQFDREILYQYGIVDWSYLDADGEKVPATTANFDLMDEITAKWAAQQIVNLTRPPTEEEEGNS